MIQDQDYENMGADLQSGECVTINEKDEVFFCRKYMGKIGRDFSEKFLWFVIRQKMESENFWPNIYRINDHGNISLMSRTGREIRSWV